MCWRIASLISTAAGRSPNQSGFICISVAHIYSVLGLVKIGVKIKTVQLNFSGILLDLGRLGQTNHKVVQAILPSAVENGFFGGLNDIEPIHQDAALYQRE
jgi:hypothetical protein